MLFSVYQCFYVVSVLRSFLFRSTSFIYTGFYSFIFISEYSIFPYLSFILRQAAADKLYHSLGQKLWSSKHGSPICIECTIFNRNLPAIPLYGPSKTVKDGIITSWPTRNYDFFQLIFATTRFSKFKYPEIRWSIVSLSCLHNRLSVSVSSFKLLFLK
jgi:hypothetical protein